MDSDFEHTLYMARQCHIGSLSGVLDVCEREITNLRAMLQTISDELHNNEVSRLISLGLDIAEVDDR